MGNVSRLCIALKKILIWFFYWFLFQRSFIALDYPGSRVCFDEEEDDDDEGDHDIETVMAATPAHSIMEPPQNGVTMATVQASPGPSSNTQSAQTGQQMSTNETHILKVNYCRELRYTV